LPGRRDLQRESSRDLVSLSILYEEITKGQGKYFSKVTRGPTPGSKIRAVMCGVPNAY